MQHSLGPARLSPRDWQQQSDVGHGFVRPPFAEDRSNISKVSTTVSFPKRSYPEKTSKPNLPPRRCLRISAAIMRIQSLLSIEYGLALGLYTPAKINSRKTSLVDLSSPSSQGDINFVVGERCVRPQDNQRHRALAATKGSFEHHRCRSTTNR